MLQRRLSNRIPTIYTEHEYSYQKIYELIISMRLDGITQSEIVRRIPQLHRTTVYRITRRLETESKIIIKRKGKTTTYFTSNQDCYRRILRASSIFASFGVNVIGMSNYISYKTLEKILKVDENSDSVRVEKLLFDYCNQVGGIILYAIILGLDFRLISQLCSAQVRELSLSEKDDLVDFWIEKLISANVVSIMSKLKYTPSVMDKVPDLEGKFHTLYPNLYKRLQFYTKDLIEETAFSLEKDNRKKNKKHVCINLTIMNQIG
jgi:hypothetical protein